jgi:hypothetical protein
MSLNGCLEDREKFSQIIGSWESRFRKSELMLVLMPRDRVLKDENVRPEDRQDTTKSSKHTLRRFGLYGFRIEADSSFPFSEASNIIGLHLFVGFTSLRSFHRWSTGDNSIIGWGKRVCDLGMMLLEDLVHDCEAIRDSHMQSVLDYLVNASGRRFHGIREHGIEEHTEGVMISLPVVRVRAVFITISTNDREVRGDDRSKSEIGIGSN